jgi:hypothetical protein
MTCRRTRRTGSLTRVNTPPANESKPEPGEPSSDDAPTEDDEDKTKPKNFVAPEAAKQFVEAFKHHIRGV